MQIINNRIIINENDIDMDCRRIENSTRGLLYSLGYPDSTVEVFFDDDNYNEKYGKIWNSITIHIIHPNDNHSYIEFNTEGYMPTFSNGEFYYIFEWCGASVTNPATLLNESYPGMNTLEDIIWQHLITEATKATYTITLTKGR